MSSELALWAEIKRLHGLIEDLKTESPLSVHEQSWTPVLSGWSINPTNCVYRYSIKGKTCFFSIRQATAGTSDATTTSLTLPIPAATIANMTWIGPINFVDAGVTGATFGRYRIDSAGTVILFDKVPNAAGGWTASGDKRIIGCEGVYEVD